MNSTEQPTPPEVEGFTDLEEIGRGGYAVVYRARQTVLGSVVALKVLARLDLDGLAHRRFRDECLALGGLRWHPHVVVVHDAGTTRSGLPYIAMEYLPEGSLADRLEQDGPLPWQDVTSYGVQVAGALETAHRHDPPILHRDVKPENVLIGRFGEAKLTDFGISAIAGSTRTATGIVSTTIAHAAPEILGGARASVASDVYALGSTMFTLLVGQPAFVEATDESVLPVLARVTSMPVPDLRPLGIPDDLATAIEWVMAKAPADRPESAAAFGRALQDVQRRAGLPVTDMRLPDDHTVVVGGASPTPLATPPAPTAHDRTHEDVRVEASGATRATAVAATRGGGGATAAMTPAPASLPEASGRSGALPGRIRRRWLAAAGALAATAAAGIAIVVTSGGDGTTGGAPTVTVAPTASPTTGAAATPAPTGGSAAASTAPVVAPSPTLAPPTANASGRLAIDGPVVTGEIESPGAVDAYRFDGQADQRIYLDVMEPPTGGCPSPGFAWTLERPDGSTLFRDASMFTCTDQGPFVLPVAGTYTLTVDPSSDTTGPYAFRVLSVPAPETFSIAVGDTVGAGSPHAGAGEIESPGAVDAYRFDGQADQRIYLDVMEPPTGGCPSPGFAWTLERPDGSTLFRDASMFTCTDQGPFVLPVAGTYTLTVDPSSDTTGPYAFRVLSVPAPETFSIAVGDTVGAGSPHAGAGEIESPGAVDAYRFDGQADQRIYLDVMEPPTGGCPSPGFAWTLERPDGSTLFRDASMFTCTDQGPFVLPVAGTYTLTVDPSSDTTGPYAFRIVPQ